MPMDIISLTIYGDQNEQKFQNTHSLDFQNKTVTCPARRTSRGRGLDEWSMALQSVCIAVERKTVGSSPGVAVDFYLQSQLVF